MSEDGAVEGCLFCQIATGRIKAEVVLSDERCVAFRDINPQAPTHVLVIPRRHVADATAASGAGVWEDVMSMAARVAREQHCSESGYRLVTNTGHDAQQSVRHLHVHVLGGRGMSWPPG